MRPRLLAVLVALLGSLSLTVPAAWAAPTFSATSIDPVTFYTTPGSACTGQNPNQSLQPPNSATLPTAAPSGSGTISYAIANLPTGVSLSGNTLTGAPATISAQAATTYTYTATDSADSQTATLTFTLEVVSERAILQTLFNNTDGPNWTNKTGGWANPITATCLNDLHGVEVGYSHSHNGIDVRGRVINLGLNGNNLSGPLPATLGKLDKLFSLVLNDNKLTGPIPDLSALSNLGGLNLNINQLSGKIPTKLTDPNDRTSRVIALPTSLVTLNLHTNQLTGPIPPGIGALTDLLTLHLHTNQLTGEIPPEIGNLTELTALWLHTNQLSGPIPAEIGTLTKLETLLLYRNLLSEIPAEIGTLTKLQDLRLNDNLLSGPIPDLSALSSLYLLFLHRNQLTGEIPTKLTDPNDPASRVIALPTGLSYLTLFDNQLTGSIPPEIGTLPMIYLYLHRNQLSGEIPSQIGDLTSLTRLTLHSNAGLYNYPSGLATKSGLHLLTPGTSRAVCLPTTSGGADCTIPTKVDQLRLHLSPTQIKRQLEAPSGRLHPGRL